MDFGHNKEDWQSLKMIWQVYLEKKFKKRRMQDVACTGLETFSVGTRGFVHTTIINDRITGFFLS